MNFRKPQNLQIVEIAETQWAFFVRARPLRQAPLGASVSPPKLLQHSGREAPRSLEFISPLMGANPRESNQNPITFELLACSAGVPPASISLSMSGGTPNLPQTARLRLNLGSARRSNPTQHSRGFALFAGKEFFRLFLQYALQLEIKKYS